ncbi:pentatricopeptide repeat-containing protein At4g21705, mitochondrial [Phoenix dactylifera]|uniref:Pentatricopeptide repeat-containing protein At4g21705, mitochondrial n=1 Tax=Phoenix dactylifera TaxID=42345 RepID=A0A8B8ZPJ7_PHODC|nr:pentatricopeptide repeat-containing protein At4g21705, mitochondrial [Phoenix dactylifera]XP_038976181.1 pentatricopeptide repeat-containing protein At4g21705, mitochondrial [Phoenix dactylifera]
MDSGLFSLARGLRRAFQARLRSPETFGLQPSRSYCMKKAPRQTLQSMIWPLGHPSVSLAPELDRWVEKRNRVRLVELHNIIRELRKRRRYNQALEVSEWMKNKGKVSFMPSDHAVHLDLIGEVHGLASAESYFNGMHEKDKTEKTYGALLNCYVRERLTEKALSHMHKMKVMGLASSPLPYNDIMCLYTNTGQHEKVPLVLAEMKDNGVLPDNFSYRICINSYGTRRNVDGMEKVLEEMEHQPQIVVDWNTYAVVANIYIKAGLIHKAVSALQKAEEKQDKKNGLGYSHLISLYGHLGMKSKMQKLWELQKLNCKKFINKDYTAMLGALVKLGELEEAEVLLKEWESSGNALDFRVPNILLIGYRQKGLLEKAEAMLDNFLNKGKTPPANSWGIVATGYAEKGKLDKAYEFMKNALCVYVPNAGWQPNPKVVKSILHYINNEGDNGIKDVETFIGLLKIAMPMDQDMYHTLIKANVRAGRDVDDLLKSMEANGIQQNEETRKILRSIC